MKSTNIFKNLFQFTNVADKYTIAILSIYISFALLFSSQIADSVALVLTNLTIIISIILIGCYSSIYQDSKYLQILRRFYYVPLIYVIYSQIQTYIKVINPYDYDWLLIKLDYSIFGCNPTQALHSISFPALTEFLQICYFLYFIMPIMQAVELMITKQDEKYLYFMRNILFGFYLSYLLYLFLPAIGPRFTLHDFAKTSLELPGLLFTDALREIVNSGGGVQNPALAPALQVNRDCMPSGHTWLTLTNLYFAFKFKSKFRYAFLLFGSGLIFATVYMRYHYVVDLIVGSICFAFAVYIEPKLAKKLS